MKIQNKEENIPCSWVGRISIVEGLYYPKRSRDSMQFLSIFRWHVFAEIEKKHPKFIWNIKGLHIAKTILKKKIKFRGLILSNFKTYYKVTIIKILWYCHKKIYRPREQNRELRNKLLCIWSNDFWQGWIEYTKEKGQSLQQMVLQKLISTCKRIKSNPYFIYYN